MTVHDFGAIGQGIHAHGTRQNYQTGCRCLPCRSADACYHALHAKRRALGASGWVDAGPAKAHLEHLAVSGIGLQQAAALSRVSFRTLQAIRNGARPRITKKVAMLVLATKPIPALGSTVNSYRTRHLLACLQREGYVVQQIAHALGLRSGRVQFHHGRITVRNALKVRALFRRWTAE